MNVRVLFILLLVSVLLAFTPRFRRIGLTSFAVLVALLLWITIRETQQPDEPSQTSSVRSNSSSTSAATQPRAKIIVMQLDGRGAPWHLKGSVQNVSDSPIQWLSLNMERYDCPTDIAALTDCSLLWQGVHPARLPIAAGATGKIDDSFYSHGPVPTQKGVLRDRIIMADAG